MLPTRLYARYADPQFAETVSPGTVIAMRDPFFNLVGLLTVTDKYVPDKVRWLACCPCGLNVSCCHTTSCFAYC